MRKLTIILLALIMFLATGACACDEESLQAGQNIKDIITNAGESLTPEDMSRLKEEAAKIQIPTEVPTMTPKASPTPSKTVVIEDGIRKVFNQDGVLIQSGPVVQSTPVPSPVLTSMTFTVGKTGDENDLIPQGGEEGGTYLRIFAYDQDGKQINHFNPPGGSKITFTVSAGGKLLNQLTSGSNQIGPELIRTWGIGNEEVLNFNRIWGDTLKLIKDENITIDFLYKGGDGKEFTGSVTKPRTYLLR